MLLKFCDAMNLAVANTWFKKGNSNLVTHESGGCWTVVDYMLIQQNEYSTARHVSTVKNVNVSPGESCIPQHRVMICTLDLNGRLKRNRHTYVSKI